MRGRSTAGAIARRGKRQRPPERAAERISSRLDEVRPTGPRLAELVLQHSGEDRRADRAADPLGHVERGGCSGHGGPVELGVRHRHDGCHHAARPDADHEQGRRHHDIARAGRRCGVDGQAGHHERQPGQHRDPTLALIGEPARDGHGQGRTDALWHQQQPRDTGRLAPDDLVVERQQEHRADQHGAEQHLDRDRESERPVGEQPQVEQRPLDPQRVPCERRDQCSARSDGNPAPDLVESAALREHRQSVHECHDAGGQHREPEAVQPLRTHAGLALDDSRRQPQGGEAERDVEDEHPSPRHGGHHESTHDRSEHRPEHHRDADDAHRPSHASGAGCLRDQRHADWHDHAATEALQDAERDEALGRPRRRAQCGGADEQGEREEPHLLAPEPRRGPAGQRDDRRQAQHVARHDPLDRGQGRAEVASQCLDRDAHDRGVEDGHDGTQHDHGGNCHHVSLEGPRLGGIGWDLRCAGHESSPVHNPVSVYI